MRDLAHKLCESQAPETAIDGNEAWQKEFHSGCIVCLYSCPGSKIGNARYTVRDYEKETTRFRVRPGALPPDSQRVIVILRLRSSP